MLSVNPDKILQLDVLTGVAIESDLAELDERVTRLAMSVAELALAVDGSGIRHGNEHLVLDDVAQQAMEVA